MRNSKAVLGLLVTILAAAVLNEASCSPQQAFPLWDHKESVADYAEGEGIKDAWIALALGGEVTMKLALVPAGTFPMGSALGEKDRCDDEGPQHEVTITRPFYMGVYSVTQEQYQAVMGKNPSYFTGGRNPVETVSWHDAAEFCKRLSRKAGKTVRLPTEAQWEYACRAGSKTRFCFGDDYGELGDYAWDDQNSDGKTHPAGHKKPNDWGMYDMYGNVCQWCADWYGKDSYASSGKTDPSGPASGSCRVLRGGSCRYVAPHCRSARRDFGLPDCGDRIIGFRVVVDLDSQPAPGPGRRCRSR
jgi:formylglycine-generating enzyme required for sulfatase activity